MVLLIIVLPFLSFVLLFFLGRFLGRNGSAVLALSLLGIAFFLSVLAFYEILFCGTSLTVSLFTWVEVGSMSQPWVFLFDSATGTMLLVILSISFLVHLYSLSYMGSDPYLIRFISYLSLFTFFMLCFVTSGNCLQMFLGWEGVGLSSYLLINFWYTRLPANKAAIKAVVVNRFGDFALILLLLTTYFLFRSFDYGVIFSLSHGLIDFYITLGFWEVHGLSLIAVLAFIGCVGKSAQMGLHTWLPDAMEGPTPVSALIHAATMVTAGVFLLVRFSPILELAPNVLPVVSILGALTAFFAATVGVFQNDLKRVIAYSTCSQLGYMVLACGLSQYSLALFHLMNHAFFKALLFLSAGSVIHALADEQDMRRMGGLVKLLPFTYVCFLVGSLALMGFPYTAGFYSKDLILEILFTGGTHYSFFGYLFALLAAFFTAFYSFRLIYFVFYMESSVKRASLKTLHEPDYCMTAPLVLLGFASLFAGYLFRDLFVGLGSSTFMLLQKRSLFFDEVVALSEFCFASSKSLPVLLSLLFAFLALYCYSALPTFFQVAGLKGLNDFSLIFLRFFNKKWYFDVLYNGYIVTPFLKFGNDYTFKSLDRGIIEFFGPTGLVRFWLKFTPLFVSLQSGLLFNYVFCMVVSLAVLLVSRYFFLVTTPLLLLSVLFFSIVALNGKNCYR